MKGLLLLLLCSVTTSKCMEISENQLLKTFNEDRSFNKTEIPYNPKYAYKELFDAKSHCKEHPNNTLPPILIKSENAAYNHIIAYILCQAIGKRYKVSANHISPAIPELDELLQEQQVTLVACELFNLLQYHRKKIKNDRINKKLEIDQTKINPKTDFFKKLEIFKKKQRLLIATETNTKRLPKSIKNLFLYEQGETTYPTIMQLTTPSVEIVEYFNITYEFLEKNKHYILQNSAKGDPAGVLDALFIITNLFLDFKVPTLKAKEILYAITPNREELTNEKIPLWTKTIIKEIANNGYACKHCLSFIHNKKHVFLQECCSWKLCEKCFNARSSWSEHYRWYMVKTICPLCKASQKNNVTVIDPQPEDKASQLKKAALFLKRCVTWQSRNFSDNVPAPQQIL